MEYEQVTFINSRGQSIVLNNRLPFLLESVDGKGSVGASLQTTTAPYQDGSHLIDALLENREITLTFAIIANDRNDLHAKRQLVGSIFNPKLKCGILRYQNGETVREIEVVADGLPAFPTGESVGKWFQRVTVNLVATNPYWRSLEYTEEPMSAFVELFEFAFDDFFELGIEGHTRTFINNGDTEVPLLIKIHGPCTNPKLLNATTGEYIRVNYTLSDKDIVEISTENNNKYVLLNGINIFNLIDLNTVFFKLAMGENEIKFTADQGQESANLEIKWREQFVTV